MVSPVSSVVTSGGQQPISVFTNNIGNYPEQTVTLTCGTNSSANFTNLLFLLGPNSLYLVNRQSCTIPNQTATTGCILTSSIANGATAASLAEYVQYNLCNNGILSGIKIIATNPALYAQTMYMHEMAANGVVNPQPVRLPEFAQASASSSSNYMPFLYIPLQNLSMSRTLSMWFDSVPYSSTVTIIFQYAKYGIDGVVTRPS